MGTKILKYGMLTIIGFLIIIIGSRIQQTGSTKTGEYYYSSFLNNNYTVFTGSLFCVAGILTGYFFKLNPWLAGLALILIFPLVSFYEATVYRGSHNLIPFELVMYFLYSLPAIVGAYLGKIIANRVAIAKHGQ
ncbi:MAG: hypothetical protein EOO48_01545 [Flavobacterium sp.]|nr:MAG: hypothetical protein EOO48_01545 [Flavobacterium sp.]